MNKGLPRTVRLPSSGVLLGLLLVVVAPSAPAQIWRRLQSPQDQARDQQEREALLRSQQADDLQHQSMFPYSTMPRGLPLPFHLGYRPGLQQLFPANPGLPSYPGNVPGYGNYPGAAQDPGKSGVPSLEPGMLKPDDGNAWPSWITHSTAKVGSEATADQAVLVRVTDRVWLRAPGEPAYVPLAFHDRFRVLQTGSQVGVRGKGEYQVVTHDGGKLSSRGPCSLTVVAMSEREMSLELSTLDSLWLSATLRPVHAKLPDGTELDFTNSAVYLERRGSRCRLENNGNSVVKFRGAAGRGELRPTDYMTLWMQEPATVAPADALQVSGDLVKSQSGAATELRGAAKGRVDWSGARFKVEEGATLSVAPLPNLSSKR
ncbi:MAG: hypothetical protein KDC87_11715 [Planctomycetes bacterium]|nr:hypothetical protein [Planctomycetota bacterium]MCB9869479.1 hypothetical protein [Planctomycetota bacterium]